MNRSFWSTVVVLACDPSRRLAGASPPKRAQTSEGTVPRDAQGRPLNLGFEAGTLADWTAEGIAFKGQPIEGDTVSRRRGDMHSRHAGRFWVGTYEKSGDPATGHADVGAVPRVQAVRQLPGRRAARAPGRASSSSEGHRPGHLSGLRGRSRGHGARRRRSVRPSGQGDRDPAGRLARAVAGATSTSTTSGCTTRSPTSRARRRPRHSTSMHTPASSPKRPPGR